MATLPDDFTPEILNTKTYTYSDALQMVEDFRRVRLRTGWWFDVQHPKDGYFMYSAYNRSDDEDSDSSEVVGYRCVQFRIRIALIRQNLWGRMYPGRSEEAIKLRHRLLSEGSSGHHKVLNEVNALTPNVSDSGPNRLAVLMDGEDL